MSEQYLTTAEVAKEMRVSQATVINWCQWATSGSKASPLHQDECFRAGYQWRVKASAVERIKSGEK